MCGLRTNVQLHSLRTQDFTSINDWMRSLPNSPLPLIAVCLFAVFIAWLGRKGLSQYPFQPPHASVARVVAIEGAPSRFGQGDDLIYVRSPTASGLFKVNYRGNRCSIGQEVPVLQRGVALFPLPKTCR